MSNGNCGCLSEKDKKLNWEGESGQVILQDKRIPSWAEMADTHQTSREIYTKSSHCTLLVYVNTLTKKYYTFALEVVIHRSLNP